MLKSKKSGFNQIRSGKVGFEIEKLMPINRPGISVRLTFSDDRIQTDNQNFTILHAFTSIDRKINSEIKFSINTQEMVIRTTDPGIPAYVQELCSQFPSVPDLIKNKVPGSRENVPGKFPGFIVPLPVDL